ncbi:spore coat protein [Alkalihalobacillus sp. AL-G]|uniref:spore coat protein n=1 Tax=Alkalihalobacillus sp. AL-G TaxID=2926399 RepID=UPI00272C69AE|nr:spore coat protein [Alkalihalobacillus sp. AL-G]WLD91649.1 spore coat protein [Alkalihalobacillus sp. AL-G]
MNEKDMVNDYLAALNGSIGNYGKIIAETENPQLRQALQQIRNEDEQRQFSLYQAATQKGYYKPAAQANPTQIQQVKSELTAPQQQQ